MSKIRIAVGLILLIVGLFIFSTEGGDLDRLGFGEIGVATLLVLLGLTLTVLGVRKNGGITTPEGVSIPRVMRRKGKTEFQGTVVGKPYEIDVKKSWAKSGQISKFKAALKIKIVDKEGNPLGVTEVVFEDRDNYKALHDGDNVWIRGKWNKDGRVVVKEAQNLTTRTMVKRHRRFGWLKKVVGFIVFLIVLYILYHILLSILE